MYIHLWYLRWRRKYHRGGIYGISDDLRTAQRDNCAIICIQDRFSEHSRIKKRVHRKSARRRLFMYVCALSQYHQCIYKSKRGLFMFNILRLKYSPKRAYTTHSSQNIIVAKYGVAFFYFSVPLKEKLPFTIHKYFQISHLRT